MPIDLAEKIIYLLIEGGFVDVNKEREAVVELTGSELYADYEFIER